MRRVITLPDGKTLRREFKEGYVMWLNAQTHIGANSGDTPTHVLKREIGACASK